jgi:hypothetical protein
MTGVAKSAEQLPSTRPDRKRLPTRLLPVADIAPFVPAKAPAFRRYAARLAKQVSSLPDCAAKRRRRFPMLHRVWALFGSSSRLSQLDPVHEDFLKPTEMTPSSPARISALRKSFFRSSTETGIRR